MGIKQKSNTVHFNSQPHKEADCTKQSNDCTQKHFNSQPHKEADSNLIQ